jgi:hypothetical protein
MAKETVTAPDELIERLKSLAPLSVGDRFEDYPGPSDRAYILSHNSKFASIIAKDVYRPMAILLVEAFNEKYAAKNEEPCQTENQ